MLGLDIGTKRIGVARASYLSKLAAPLTIIPVDGSETEKLQTIIADEGASRLVVGLPRNLEGVATQQTKDVEEYVKTQLLPLGLPIDWQDEAGSTVEAGLRMKHKSKFKHPDAHAAVIILQDYLDNL